MVQCLSNLVGATLTGGLGGGEKAEDGGLKDGL